MRIELLKRSDYWALLLGDPKRIQLGLSDDVARVKAELPARRPDEAAHVLLLGGTGFVGMHVLKELLARDDVGQVTALVRRGTAATLEERIESCFAQYGMSLPETDKLRIMEGSFTKHHLGLSNVAFRDLRANTDLVLNAAGSTNHTYSYPYYRNESIANTLRLIEFCLTDRLKTFHSIGSVGCEVYKQRRDFFRLGFFHCGYSRMKWVTKHILLQLAEQGVPAHLYLPSFVLGSPQTSFKDPGLRYSFWMMMWYASQLGMMWDCGSDRIPIVPADALARSVLDNAFSHAPQTVTYPAVYVSSQELASTFGLRLVSWQQFRTKLIEKYGMKIWPSSWRQPLASLVENLKHGLFARSLFPSNLPQLISNISEASVAGGGNAQCALAPIDLVSTCVSNNYMLQRCLR